MQPLDCTLYSKALKASYNAATDSWMVSKSNPGNSITFFHMADLFGKTFARSLTQYKAVLGFGMCGMWDCDPHVFDDADITAAEVTEEPGPVYLRHDLSLSCLYGVSQENLQLLQK